MKNNFTLLNRFAGMIFLIHDLSTTKEFYIECLNQAPDRISDLDSNPHVLTQFSYCIPCKEVDYRHGIPPRDISGKSNIFIEVVTLHSAIAKGINNPYREITYSLDYYITFIGWNKAITEKMDISLCPSKSKK